MNISMPPVQQSLQHQSGLYKTGAKGLSGKGGAGIRLGWDAFLQ